MSQNNSNDKAAMLAKIEGINKVDGFDPTPFAVDYTDLETGEVRKRLPVMIQMAWFRMKYSRMKRLYHTEVWYGRFLLCFSRGGESDVLIAVIIIVTTNHFFIHSMPSWHVAYIAVKHAVKRYVFSLLWWHAQRRHGNGPQAGIPRTG